MAILGISASQNIKSFLVSINFVAVANSSSRVARSTDGVTWLSPKSGPEMPTSASWYSVAYGGGVFAAVAYYSDVAASSTDGTTWTQRTLPGSAAWWAVAAVTV